MRICRKRTCFRLRYAADLRLWCRAVIAQRLWRQWTTPTAQGDGARRREAVLRQVLGGLVLLTLTTFVVQTVNLITISDRLGVLPWIGVTVLVGTTFYALLHRARAGHLRQSAAALIGLFVALTLLLSVLDGTDRAIPSILLVLTVLLAAILLGGRPGLYTALTLASLYVGIGGLEQVSALKPPTERDNVATTVEVGLVLLVCGAILNTYTREAFTPIDDALTHGSAASPLRQLRTRHLSMREIEVVQLVAEGLSNDGIAAKLFVSPRTVQTHVANAMKKTDCANRTELGVLAVREGLVPLTEETNDDGAGPGEAAEASVLNA
jgi:DNA-binding CsgD family transcriptional regulator